MDPLKRRALLETMHRTKSGIFVYIGLWIVIGFLTDLPQTHSGFWAANAAIFLLNAVLRIALNRSLPGMLQQKYGLARKCFVTLALANALHWGLLAALTVVSPETFGALRIPMLLAGCGIAAAGTMTYAIDRNMRLSFAAMLLIPVVVALFLNPTEDNVLVGSMALVFVIYVIAASARIGGDYWNALATESLLEEKAKELEELSFTDGLTTLRNRRFFDIHFTVEWKRARRNRTFVALLMIDIDYFKAINDTYGHDGGDACLREIGKVIAGQMRRTGDIAARYGGEEFVVMLANTDLAGARAVANRMLEAIRQIVVSLGGREILVKCSIGGCSVVPGDAESSRLIKAADMLLYRAKESGRNRVIVELVDLTHDEMRDA